MTNDSLYLYLGSQWTPTYSFSPANSTLEEMKSSGNIGVIQNESLRRQILKTYNQYEEYEKQGEGIYGIMLEKTWEVIYDQIPNLMGYQLDLGTIPDMRKALQITEIQNRILGNHVLTLNAAMQRVIEENADCLTAVREEYRKLSKN